MLLTLKLVEWSLAEEIPKCLDRIQRRINPEEVGSRWDVGDRERFGLSVEMIIRPIDAGIQL